MRPAGQCLATSFCRLDSPPRSFGEGPGVGLKRSKTISFLRASAPLWLLFILRLAISRIGSARARAADQNVQVDAALRLLHMVEVDARIAARARG